jgi:hypothetical protein
VPNADLIRRVAKRIQAKPSLWDQSTWAGITEENDEDFEAAKQRLLNALFRRVEVDGVQVHHLLSDAIVPEGVCGTKFCFAGHTVLEAGDAIVFDPEDLDYTDMVRTPEGEYRVLEERARELLGLTGTQAEFLFDGEAGGGRWEDYKRLITATTGVDLSDL